MIGLLLRTRLQPKGYPNVLDLNGNKIDHSLKLFLTLIIIVFQAFNSHAAAMDPFSILRVLSDGLHLTAAGLWVGSLLAMVGGFTKQGWRCRQEHTGSPQIVVRLDEPRARFRNPCRIRRHGGASRRERPWQAARP